MITKATKEQATIVQSIVYEVINTTYPKYYPKDVVNFFLNHHCEENILRDIERGNVYLLLKDGCYFGTGSIDENYMNRVFILKEYQGKGYGSYLIDFLEGQILSIYDSVCLDSSLPAFNLYLKRGYIPLTYNEEIVENGCVLCYHTMVKSAGND